ncbi:MAG: hypothetical protein V1774_04035 [Candidatus Eisenbacteria bacterium]
MTTFVVRVASGPQGGLHGTIVRVASGERRTFTNAGQLTVLLEEWTASEGVWTGAGESAAPAGPAAAPAPGIASADSGSTGPIAD